MNPNIQMVNENLWVVNFNYVRMKWIEGLSFLDGSDDSNKYAALTEDGRLYVNKASDYCSDIVGLMSTFMKQSDDALNSLLVNAKKQMASPDKGRIAELTHCFVKWELTRRSVQKEYIKKHRMLPIIKNIKERWCKLWQQSKQQ